MKVLAICGSPRKGNTEFMLETILKSIPGSELILLKNLDIKRCDGDNYCIKHKECHIKSDDVADIYKKMEDADIIIFASPSYFSCVPGLMKDFIDRGNAYWNNKKLKGKKAFLLGVGGQKGIEGERVIESLKFFAKGLFMEIIGSYFTVAEDATDIKNNMKVIKDLENISEELK